MKYYTVVMRLSGALADAVALEWTNSPAPVDSGLGWEPCLRLADGTWRFSSHDAFGANPPHRRDPGVFADLTIRYRLSATGPWSAAAANRKEIVILERIEGAPETAPDPLPVIPLVVVAPILAGVGKIGSEVTVAPGVWSGYPAPQIAFQWRRDGADIPGAAARAYTPGPEDDRAALDCRVTASNAAGEAAAIAGPLRVSYAAPVLLGALPEEVFDEGAGPQFVETAFVFQGENLSFAAVGAAIDAATGVVAVPTAAPLSGGAVTITATNSGGAASVRLLFTVEADLPDEDAGPPALGAADVRILRSVWRPLGQTTSFTPVVAFPTLAGRTVESIQFCATPLASVDPVWHPVVARPGEPGAYDLLAATHPVPAGGFDAGLWVNDARRAGRLRFRWRESAQQAYSDQSSTFDVPLPATRPENDRAIWLPTQAETADAMDRVLQTYEVPFSINGEGEGTGVQYAECVHIWVVVALEAFAHEAIGGTARTYTSPSGGFTGAKSARTRLIEQLKHWSSDNQTAPAGRSGYPAQYDISFVCAVLLARRTPSVWAALTPIERTRLDLSMKGELVGNAFTTSDNHPYLPGDWSRLRTIRGYRAGRDVNANYSTPPKLIPHLVAAYLASDGGNGAALAQAFLNTFDQEAFAAACAPVARGGVGGRDDLWDTYRRRWTSAVQAEQHGADMANPMGEGPTAAQILASIRGGGTAANGRWTCYGNALADTRQALQAELNFVWSKTVKVGLTGVAGAETGPGVSQAYGTRGSWTNNVLRGCVTDKGAWAGLPNAGEVGMEQELDGNDGGGPPGNGPARRSSMSYAQKGSVTVMMAAAALAAAGAITPAEAGWIAANARMQVGVTDLKYRDRHGHRSYAKGGNTSANEDWTGAWASSRAGGGFKLESRYALARLFDRWLAGS